MINNNLNQDLRNSILPGSPSLRRNQSILPIQNRDSLVVRQNLASEVGHNVYDSVNYLTSCISISVIKVIISIGVLLFAETRCNKPLADFIFYMAIHDTLNAALLLLQLYILIANHDTVQAREAYLEALDGGGDDIGIPLRDIEALEVKLKGLRVLAFLLNIYYSLTFIYGQILYFQQDSDCAIEAPVLDKVTLVYILLGYIYIGIPLLFAVLACVCLPFVLVGVYFFSKKKQVGVKEDVINKLPVIRYNSNLTGNTECSICMLEYKEGDKLIQLKCSPMHYFHEDCLKKWLRINGLCPICRAKVGDEDIELGVNVNQH